MIEDLAPHRSVGSCRKNDKQPASFARRTGGVLIMRLDGVIQKVEPQDDGTVRVHGIASSEVTDDQGEIVRADAMRAAVPDYVFPGTARDAPAIGCRNDARSGSR